MIGTFASDPGYRSIVSLGRLRLAGGTPDHLLYCCTAVLVVSRGPLRAQSVLQMKAAPLIDSAVTPPPDRHRGVIAFAGTQPPENGLGV